MADDKLRAYRTAETLGKSQLELIVQVYDGAIASYTKARQLYLDSAWNDGYEALEKGKRFVSHLYTTLDMKKGGEVAENLSRMYVFIISQTYVVQATKDLEQLDSIVNSLSNLRDGWLALKEQEQNLPKPTAAEQAPVEVAQFVTTG
ncbi:MAG: flagellar protein FliS [candidate division Zixibacteria bacterium]|nr:flagellar protein FliS [candidate division Zixibacteria bacterium]